MNAREELFQLMLGRTTTKAVERIIAAGYRRPRVVTTVAELDALPGWTLIEACEVCFVRSSTHEACWVSITGHFAYSSAALIKRHESATVLHEPEADQ